MDRFDETLHKLGDWCANHTTATFAVIALAFGLVLGVLIAR